MSTQLRAKRLLLRQGQTLALVLATLGLLSMAAGGYVYATPPSELVTERVDVQTVSAEIQPSAVVTGETALYDRGERLEDPSAFLLRATPVATLRTVAEVPSGTAVEVDQRLTLELSATHNGEVFWSERSLLGARSQRVSDGTATMTTELDVAQLGQSVSDTREELGDVGVLRTRLNLTVSYDTGTYEGQLTVTSPVSITENAYWFDRELSTSTEHYRTVSRTVRAEPDMATVAGLELVGVGALAAAGAVVALRRREEDVDELETALAHSRYEEWISEGEFPTQTDKKFVHINSLEDLVDVAIDSNKRVLHDPSIDAYAVADGDLIYYHTLDRLAIDTWLDI